MKNLLLLIMFFGVMGAAFAQKKLLLKPFHPQSSRATIAEFLQDINQHAETVLEYSSGSFDANQVVQLEGDETTVGDVLQKVLEGQHVKLMEHNHKIILVPSAAPFSISKYLPARYSFYGYVKLTANDEPLISATIYEPATHRGVISNNEGYFNFLLSKGRHIVEVSYGGLQPVRVVLNMQRNVRKNIYLSIQGDTLTNIIVQSENPMKDGAVRTTGKQIYSKGLINEDDPLQYLYLNPGLQNGSYSFSGFQVRGGGTDENLFLLDGNPVYNPTHMLGAISILNPTVIKSMRFYKSDFPARLGGSLSSVLDVYTKQGNMNEWHGEVHAGLLAGSVTLEGPLAKDKVAVMLSGRKNIPLPYYQSLQDGITSDFYDAHFRLSAIISPRNKLAFNLYKGRDQLKQTGEDINNYHEWGNTVGSLSLNTLLGSRSFITTSVNYSEYQNLGSFQYTLFEVDDEEEDDVEKELDTKFIGTYSSIRSYSLKTKAEIYASKNLRLNTGLQLSQTTIKPFDSRITEDFDDDEADFTSFEPMEFQEFEYYAEAEIKLGKEFFIKPGLHTSVYQMDDYRTIAFQPRLYMSYQINPAHKVYASYSKMNQFLHLVTNPYAGANRDLWVPSTKNLLPEESEIYNIGYAFRHKNTWRFSLDGYYKNLTHVTNYANGKSSFINSANWEQNIELGKGRSYGVELMLRKSGEKLSLQGGYALSWSWRQFSSINNGEEFPYKYDHRHAANLGFTYAISPHIDATGLWSFATGNVYSSGGQVFADSVQQAPSGQDPLEEYNFIYHFSEQEQYRAKSYRRYDIAIIYHSLQGKKLYSSFKAGIYNINGTADQYSYNLRGALHTNSIRIKTGTSVFNIIPYLSYTLRF